jgi:hypothetical protein
MTIKLSTITSRKAPAILQVNKKKHMTLGLVMPVKAAIPKHALCNVAITISQDFFLDPQMNTVSLTTPYKNLIDQGRKMIMV